MIEKMYIPFYRGVYIFIYYPTSIMLKTKIIAFSSLIIIAIFTYMLSWYYAVLWLYNTIFWNTNAIYSNTDHSCDMIPWVNIIRQCTKPIDSVTSVNPWYLLSTKKDSLDKKILISWISQSMDSNQFNKTIAGIIAERYDYVGNELLKDNRYFIRNYASFWSGTLVEAVKQNPKNYYYLSDKDRLKLNLTKDIDTIEIMDLPTLENKLSKWEQIDSMVISDNIRSNSWAILSLLKKEPLIYTIASNNLLWNKDFILRVLNDKDSKIGKDFMAYLPWDLSNDKDVFNAILKRLEKTWKNTWIIVGNWLLNDYDFMKENSHLIEVLIMPDYIFTSDEIIKSFFKKSNSEWWITWMIWMLSDSNILKDKTVQSSIFVESKPLYYDSTIAYAIFPKKYIPSIRDNFQKDDSVYVNKPSLEKYYICMITRQYELEWWQKKCREFLLRSVTDNSISFWPFVSDLKDDLSWPDILKVLF